MTSSILVPTQYVFSNRLLYVDHVYIDAPSLYITNCTSPKDEGFQSSPRGTLNILFSCFLRIEGLNCRNFCRSIYYDLEKTQVTYPAPSGWYLMGVVVKPKFRRHYIGHRITKERLIRISESSNEAYFVVNSNNQVSIELHKKIGFKKIGEGEGFFKNQI